MDYGAWVGSGQHILFERADLRNDLQYFHDHAAEMLLMDAHAFSTIFPFDNYVAWRAMKTKSEKDVKNETINTCDAALPVPMQISGGRASPCCNRS